MTSVETQAEQARLNSGSSDPIERTATIQDRIRQFKVAIGTRNRERMEELKNHAVRRRRPYLEEYTGGK